MDSVSFRKFEESDISTIEKWLYKEHVIRWYKEPLEWLDEISKRDSEYGWITHYIVEVDGKEIGFCQYYDYSLGGETWHGNFAIDDTYSVDYMIGEVDYLGKGYGRDIAKKLAEVIMNNTNAKTIIVQPETENAASRNTLLSAGYSYDEENDVYYIAR